MLTVVFDYFAFVGSHAFTVPGALVCQIAVELVAVLAVPSVVADAASAHTGSGVLAELIATLALFAYDTVELGAGHVLV